jgi:hypothetical protein
VSRPTRPPPPPPLRWKQEFHKVNNLTLHGIGPDSVAVGAALADVYKEVTALLSPICAHPNIVTLIGVVFDGAMRPVKLLFEWADGGDLSGWVPALPFPSTFPAHAHASTQHSMHCLAHWVHLYYLVHTPCDTGMPRPAWLSIPAVPAFERPWCRGGGGGACSFAVLCTCGPRRSPLRAFWAFVSPVPMEGQLAVRLALAPIPHTLCLNTPPPPSPCRAPRRSMLAVPQ